MNLPLNVVLFQIGWFACVLGAAHGRAGLGSAIALTIVVLHCLRAPHSAVGWALLIPLMLRVAQRLDGFGAARKVELCSS